MSVYPQLVSGVISQFPLVKTRVLRTIENTAADGSTVKLADPAGELTGWRLEYTNLSDVEIGALEQFFCDMEGSLNGFTFLDPAANLLAWSEDLTNSVWQADPFLRVAGGAADFFGGNSAWQLTNSGSGTQGITQALNAPTAYTYCFSVYAFSSQATNVQLSLGNNLMTTSLSQRWSRLNIVGKADAAADAVVLGVQLPPGASIVVFGPQVEAQMAPSTYKVGTSGGVYCRARFRDDVLSLTSTDVNRGSVTVNIVYANSL